MKLMGLGVPIALFTALTIPASLSFTSDRPDAAPRRYGQVYVEEDPQGRVVAAAIRFPTGSAADAVGREGTATLLGRLIRDEANRRVVEYGAAVEVEVLRDEFLVELVVAPTGWDGALGVLEEVLYDAALPGSRLPLVRGELLETLTFELGAPVRAFELERAVFLRGPGDPGSRPIRGTVSSVELLQLADLSEYRREHLVEDRAVFAVTGPVSVADLEAVVSGPVRAITVSGDPRSDTDPAGVREPGDSLAAGAGTGMAGANVARSGTRPEIALPRDEDPLEIPATPAGAPTWTVGERTVIDRQLTSTWLSVAFPFPQGTPALLLDFLGHLVLESLTPSPPDPGLYGAEVFARSIDEAPVLVVGASVDPRITTQWEDRLASSLDSMVTQPPRGAFFELARRRFRSELLLEMAVPENRARWLARNARNGDGTVPDPVADVWRIRREAVSATAALAGPARTILYGPVEMMNR